jgi:hypothetical protein
MSLIFYNHECQLNKIVICNLINDKYYLNYYISLNCYMVVYILIVDVINVMQSASILKKFVLKIIVLALRGVR